MEFIDNLQYTADVDKKKNSIEWLHKIVDPNGDGIPHNNVAELLTKDELDKIGQKITREYNLDVGSRSEWLSTVKGAMKLAKLLIEPKNTPWQNAANVKFPLITVAAIQFAARCYPEIIKGNTPVKYQIIGKDDDNAKQARGQRISEHMSYQLLYEMHDWEVDFDRLLHVLPVIGLVFKKAYFDPIDKVNVSQLCLPDDVVIHYKAENMRSVRRITHVVNYYQNDIYERIAAGRWLDVDIHIDSDSETPDEGDMVNTFLEQHRFLDLDGDGYAEPYIVTVHESSSKVVRIVPRFEKKNIKTGPRGKLIRIIPGQYFTKYGFIPAPDGSIYDLGFGSLLYPLNESVNSLINMLLDSGALDNQTCGFIDKALRQRGGVLSFKPGEFKTTDSANIMGGLSDKIVLMPKSPPSTVLFSLLGLLIDAGKEISSVKDILTGAAPGSNTPATTVLAMIEQGLKVFGSIYKRVYRSFSQELKQLYNLNSIYLQEEDYFRIIDTGEGQDIAKDDYNQDDLDIMPTADPSISTEVQRLAKAQFLLEGVSGRPEVDETEITKRVIAAADVPDSEKLMLDPNREQQPDPGLMLEMEKLGIEKQKVAIEAQKVELDEMRLELDAHKAAIQYEETMAKITKLEADAVKSLAQAEGVEAGEQLQRYVAELDGLVRTTTERIKATAAKERGNATNRTGTQGVEASASNQGNTQATASGG